jgi:hypothetical protein
MNLAIIMALKAYSDLDLPLRVGETLEFGSNNTPEV